MLKKLVIGLVVMNIILVVLFVVLHRTPEKGECIHPDWPSYTSPYEYEYSGEHIISDRGYEIGIVGTYEKTEERCFRWRSHVSREVYNHWISE